MPDRQGSRDWTLFLSDMQRFCSRVLRYCDGTNAEQFADELVTDAVLRNLELLGEAPGPQLASIRSMWCIVVPTLELLKPSPRQQKAPPKQGKRIWLGGDLNSRPWGYESHALTS